jgi:hypothetical protein
VPDPGDQVIVRTKFCTLAPSIFWSSVTNWLYASCLVSRMLRCRLDFWAIFSPLVYMATVVFGGKKDQ